jgi:hypothetical protein
MGDLSVDRAHRGAVTRSSVVIRPVQQADFSDWLPLWDGYNAFYGRSGPTALPLDITETTWRRFFDLAEPVFALSSKHHPNRVDLLSPGSLQ